MIYFLRAGSDGPVKIGWSKNIPKRQAIIQPTMPVQLILLRTIDAEQWVEYWFHRRFDDFRLLGEWFSFDPLMLTVDAPQQKPALGLRSGRGRPLTFPDLIQCKAPPGTLDALDLARGDEDRASLLRRIIAEWLAAQKQRRAA